MTFDTIIVGGGSAGAVLASRLSEQSSRTVLLCEAGPDTPEGRVPREILDSYPGTAYLNPGWQWPDLMVTTQAQPHNQPGLSAPPKRKYEQARVLGGGSSINGQAANRGAPADFALWEQRGATGWGWPDVLPYFRRLETDLDFEGDLHGKAGPIPIRRIFPGHWNGHTKAAAAALDAAGYAYLPDQNGPFVDGYFPLAISNREERRVSTAIAYLGAAIRQRPNLTIRTDTTVTGLVMEGRRCTGVQVLSAGKAETLAAREVILSSGAIHSPAHLLRAGIGPAPQLRALGIGVVTDRPGVGQRLMDHPAVSLASFIRPQARVNAHTRRHCLMAFRYTDEGSDFEGDMFVYVMSKSSWHAVGEQIATMNLIVYRTWSETGDVTLQSGDWRVPPAVRFNLLSDSRDLHRLTAGFRRLAALHAMPELRQAVSDPFPACYSDKVRQYGMLKRRNRLATAVMARLLDGPAALRRALMRRFIMEGPTMAEALADPDVLEAFVRKTVIGVWHASCSCRMGAATDPMAVTDPAGLVYGVDGLRVCDASIFPIVPTANTNIPVVMAAEKIADAIRAGH